MAHNFEKLLSSARTGSPLPQGLTARHIQPEEGTPQNEGQPYESGHGT